MRCYVCFRFHMDILCAVEAGRAARSDTVCSQYLYCLFLQCFIPDEIVEIVGGEVGNHATVR